MHHRRLKCLRHEMVCEPVAVPDQQQVEVDESMDLSGQGDAVLKSIKRTLSFLRKSHSSTSCHYPSQGE
ncbi:MAG: hypothetical protein LZF62_480307 [Nitrospira sp.]|nr:MAG: hypothetical protein LZF62_480307 [Nitrospira sp.]